MLLKKPLECGLRYIRIINQGFKYLDLSLNPKVISIDGITARRRSYLGICGRQIQLALGVWHSPKSGTNTISASVVGHDQTEIVHLIQQSFLVGRNGLFDYVYQVLRLGEENPFNRL